MPTRPLVGRNRRASGQCLVGKRGVKLPFGGRRHVDGDAVAGSILVLEHIELVDGERPLAGENQPRNALAERAQAHAPDQAARLQVLGANCKSRIRKIDDKAVGPPQQEPFDIRFAIEIDDDARLGGIARHLVAGCHQRCVGGIGNGGRSRRDHQQQQKTKNAENLAANTTSLVCEVRQSHLFPVAPGLAQAPGRFVEVPVRPRTRLTIGIQRRLTKPFHARVLACSYATEPLFAGIGNRGCLPPRQIIKAMVDHCNPGTALLRSFLLQGQTKGGSFRFTRKGLR